MVCQRHDVETQRRDVTEACLFDFFQRQEVATSRRRRPTSQRYKEGVATLRRRDVTMLKRGSISIFFTKFSKSKKTP